MWGNGMTNRDTTEDIIYGINSEQQTKINLILKSLKVKTRKRQNINFIRLKIEVGYFPTRK